MKSLNILHLSDLHLANPTPWDQSRLLKALIEDLTKIRHSNDAPDLVIFSGDLALAGGAENAYSPVMDLLLHILDILSLSNDRLIICPGNHDVDRAIVGKNLPEFEDFRLRADTVAGANKLVDDDRFKSFVRDSFNNFMSLADAITSSSIIYADELSSTYFFRELGIGIVTLNSATLSAGGLTSSLNDQNKLFVAEKTLITALDRIPAGIKTIVVGHHPSTWMNEQGQSIFERIISSKSIAYFSGHLHEASPRQSRLLGGSFLHAQSGALYCGRPYWNGYTYLNLNLEKSHARLSYRRWFEQRLGFSKAEDLGDEGIFYSSDEAKSYWDAVTPSIDLSVIDHWRSTKLLPFITEKCNDSFAGSTFDSLFVPPDFERDIPFRSEGEGRVGSRVENINFKDLISAKTNYVVSAQGETGKSTLLKQVALILSQEASKSEYASLPVIIQFDSIRGYIPRLEKLVRDQLPELPGEIGYLSLLETGMLTVLVDDVDFTSKTKKKTLVEFVSKYPKCRYIFTSSTTFVEVASLQPEIVPDVPFVRVRMKAFRKINLQALVQNYGLKDPLKIDQMVERVIRDASALNVPLTAVTGTFLIQIIREEPDSTVINQAALIERYVEMLLQKYAPKELLPGAFDFKNKVDLLCNIAEIMTRNNEYNPDQNDLVSWCIAYLKTYGLRYSAGDLVNYFIEARIFEKNDERVRFRLRMFFEFFAATRMIDDPKFKSYIFDEERYLCFTNEIGFYAALNRRDKNEVERIYDKFIDLTDKIWPKGNPIHDIDDFMKNVELPDKKTTQEELRDIQNNLRSPEQIFSDREILSEGTDLTDSDQDQSITRYQYATAEEQWVGHLMLLSGMIKHMELIQDTDKRRLLAGTLDGWSRFSAISLGIATELAEHKKVVFNGVTYKSSFSNNVPVGEVARRVTLYMPIAVNRMASIFLGTEKLRLQLEDGLGSKSEPVSRQFVRLSILADLGVDGISKLADRVSRHIRGFGYLEHVFARKLYEVAVRFRLEKDDLDGIRSIVGDTFVQLGGSQTKGKSNNQKNTVINGMNQQRMQVGLFNRKNNSE